MDHRSIEIAFPGWVKHPSGLYLPLSLEMREVEALPPGFTEEAQPVFLTKPRGWSDQVSPYVTSDVLGLPTLTLAGLRVRLEGVPLEPAMLFLGSLQRALTMVADVRQQQFALVNELFGNSPAGDRTRAFLNTHRGGMVFFEQQVYIAQKLMLLFGDPVPTPTLTTDHQARLLISLLSIPSAVIDKALDHDPDTHEPTSDDVLAWFLTGSHFAHREWLGSTLTRALGIFHEAASDPSLSAEEGYRDLGSWLDDEHGITVEELLCGGLGLAAGSKLLDLEEPFNPVDPEGLRPYLGEAATDGAVAALVGEPAWYRYQFAKKLDNPKYLARDITAFMQRPFCRRANGSVVAIGPRVVQEALSERGLYFRFHELSKSKNGGVRGYSTFVGRPYERYVLAQARTAHAQPASTTVCAAGRVHGDMVYTVQKGRDHRSPDVLIDYVTDLVAVETTSSHLTQKTLIEGNRDQLAKDLGKIVVEKLPQLADRIEELLSGCVPIPDLDVGAVRRVWPILVIFESLLQTDPFWDYIDEQCGKNLFIDQARVMPPTILDVDEFEGMMGEVASGRSLVSMLERKTQPQWQRRDLRAWFEGDPRAIGDLGRAHQEERFGRTMDVLLARLKPDNQEAA